MKLFFVTFAIAVMVQVSMAGPLSRHKRSDAFVDIFQETIQMLKKTLPSVETLLKNSLKDIPKTPAYAKHIQLIEAYLEEMREYNNVPGNCIEKNVAMFEKFMVFVGELQKDIESPETQEVDKIFDNNGGVEIIKDFQTYAEKLKNPEVENALGNITGEDALKIAPLIIEVC